MLRNRPAAFLCLVFSAGIAAGLFLKYWLILAIAVCACVCLLTKKHIKRRFNIVLLICCALLAGASYSALFTLLFSAPTPDKDEIYCFNAAVVSVTERSEYTTVELKVQDDDSLFNGYNMYAYLKSDVPEACSVVKLYGSVTESKPRAKSNGVDYVFYGSVKPVDGESAKGLSFSLIRFRAKVGNAIESTFEVDSAGFYRALITGDRSGISLDMNASFSRSGILHILSVSGQHFSLLVLGLYRLLMGLFKNKKACSVVCIAAAVAYALFTGLSPSVVRAAFMCCVIFAANIFRERSDSLITLLVVLALMLVAEPYAVLNTSLQLSFLATLGIILTLNQLDRFYEDSEVKGALRWFITPIALTISATLFCMPIYLLGFDYVSISSPATNVLANALVGPAMVCSILAVPLNAIGLGIFSLVPEMIYSVISHASDLCAGLRFSCISLHVPYIWLLIVPSVVIAIVYCAFYVKRGMTVLFTSSLVSVAVCFGCFFAMEAGYNDRSLLYVYENSANCYAFYAGNSSYVLVDGGGEEGASDGALINGCAYLDAYVITDCTENALTRLQKTMPYLPANRVYIPENDSNIANDIIAYCKDKGCAIEIYNTENGLSLSGISIYGAYGDEDESAFLIKSEKDGTRLAVLGRSASIYEDTWDADCLVVTRACTSSPYDPDLLPEKCDTAIVYKGDESFLTKYITSLEIATRLKEYKNSVTIRFGNNSVYEVVE